MKSSAPWNRLGKHRPCDLVVEVGGGEHRDDTRRAPCRLDVEARDAGAGNVAAHERRVQHPVERHVVDVPAVAGEQPGILLAEHLLADETPGRRHALVFVIPQT